LTHDRILAIDYGRVRLGLAVSDGLGLASHPLPALDRTKDDARDFATLAALAESRDVRRLVVGLPLNMDGSEGPMAAEARAFAERAAAALELPLTMEDERLTTDAAESYLKKLGLRPSDRKKLRDSVAAALILQAVLEQEGA